MTAKFEYTKSSYGEMFQVLKSLRQHGLFSDIKLETDDGTIIFGHKVILASASPYFQAMFTNFGEKNKDHVVIRQLDSIILQLLVDFIYSGTILITKKNVQDLLAASNLLQLNDLKETCCEFFQKQLHPTNCLGIKAFADVHSCTKLLSSSELYIKQYFLKVVESEEFLSLSSEELVKLISCDELKVSSEEEVFESVLRWVKNELDSRKCFLPQLMEHVRLAFTSENYIIQKVLKEPILNNCLKCKEYINEVLHFHFPKRHESDQVIPIPERIRYKPRLEDKV
ncbi:kelch-like protein 2 [Acyrthosiphon pisum]|uniref:BTB domain-containing protein n=1 Tax=Acyrthosiphon pisum TaxID=7029 RepID=A0A8R2NML8_ACYPI|nr:kelch-like protein 2 [Acyrthosiphon pisum]